MTIDLDAARRRLDTDLWFACETPERPTDPYVVWHYADCVACRIKAHALMMQHPDDEHVAWLNDTIAASVGDA